MKESLHYLLMANQIFGSAPTPGSVKEHRAYYWSAEGLWITLTDHDGSSQKEGCEGLFSGGRITDLNSKPYMEEGPD